ncbi:MAG: hypothetical protein ABI977_06275 [Acidobacteriota bacterium]
MLPLTGEPPAVAREMKAYREVFCQTEERGKHWVSEIERSRHINWQAQWRRVDEVAEGLHAKHPESFRHLKVKVCNGNEREYWAFTKVVRLKNGYGLIGIRRDRLVLALKARTLIPR